MDPGAGAVHTNHMPCDELCAHGNDIIAGDMLKFFSGDAFCHGSASSGTLPKGRFG